MKSSNSIRQTLLVIDDQEENLRILGAILTMMGYDLIPAFDGKQALQRLSARLPDLILLDIVLPDIDGVALCRKIKENPAWHEIPIIFVSASDDKNLVVQALETGGVDYITKPYNKAELISRVRAHLALKESRDALRALAADKDVLLGMLAHDFKNHLAGVMMSARVLSERTADLPERSAALIKEIGHSSERMLGFIHQFHANHQAATEALTPQPFDASAVIRQVARHHGPHALSKNITLTCTMPDTPMRAIGDTNGLRQIMENLISNAIKFVPPEGVVAIDGKLEPGRVVIEVSDNGPGFSEDDRGRLFKRYARLSAQPTAGEPSTGLGLHIAKRLVGQMGGRLDLITPPGETGARFQVILNALTKTGNPD